MKHCEHSEKIKGVKINKLIRNNYMMLISSLGLYR